MANENSERRRANYLSVTEAYNLNVVCRLIACLYGYGVYQVGSSLERQDYRDVDLRCILGDSEYDRMFCGESADKRLRFLNVAISEWIAARTGLPIDFQFQRQTQANAQFSGQRNAVGILD